MFTKTNAHETQLKTAIAELIEELRGFVVGSEDYVLHLEQIERLHKMLPPTQEKRRVGMVDLLQPASNLIGIAAILVFEKSGEVIVTKALSFVGKGK